LERVFNDYPQFEQSLTPAERARLAGIVAGLSTTEHRASQFGKAECCFWFTLLLPRRITRKMMRGEENSPPRNYRPGLDEGRTRKFLEQVLAFNDSAPAVTPKAIDELGAKEKLPTGAGRETTPQVGPEAPNELHGIKKTVILEPKPFKLVEYMYEKKLGAKVRVDTVASTMWKPNQKWSAGAFANHITKANVALIEAGFTWSLSVKGEFVVKS
ncbi:MAG: hypothetical protein FD138_1417, partial [Planctomycetota bacterium]